jgi:transposase
MIGLPTGVRVWIAAGHTDMRRGMQSLALQVQEGVSHIHSDFLTGEGGRN